MNDRTKNTFHRQNQEPNIGVNISKISAIPNQNMQSSYSEADSFIKSSIFQPPKPPKTDFFNQTTHQNFMRPDENQTDSENEAENYENEPTLLEELDIDIESVKSRLKSTLFFFKPDPEFVKKPDLTGPFFLATILVCVLLLVF